MVDISTAIPSGQSAAALAIETQHARGGGAGPGNLPQRIAIVAQGSSAVTYPSTKFQITTALEVAKIMGYGCPAHLIAEQLFPVNGDGVGIIPVEVLPLQDGGGATVSTGDIEPAGAVVKAGAFRILINKKLASEFVVELGDSLPDIAGKMTTSVVAVLALPMLATTETVPDRCSLTSKWKGTSANGLKLEVVGPSDTGITFGITQPVGGLVNPDVDPVLLLIGNVWTTKVINALEVEDTTNLDRYQTYGEGRNGAEVHKPLVVFTGATPADTTVAISITDTRKLDYVNSQLVEPGGSDLPFVVAGREVARIAVKANNTPSGEYVGLLPSGLTAGADEDQWGNTQLDLVMKGGSSTAIKENGEVVLWDTVVMYHPDGDPDPAHQYVNDRVKLMQVIYQLDVEFDTDEWRQAAIVNDDDVTKEPTARKPKDAVSAIKGIEDDLGLAAILADVANTKKQISVEISPTDSRRLNMVIPVTLSGNSNKRSATVKYSRLFG